MKNYLYLSVILIVTFLILHTSQLTKEDYEYLSFELILDAAATYSPNILLIHENTDSTIHLLP
jgi:hypothetical protein